jgi:hypothetical protein
MTTMDLAIWQAGHVAGVVGLSRCPYRTGTPEAWSWRAGFIEGAASILPKYSIN